MKTIYFIFSFFIISTFLTATIINVPDDQPTIQAGIDVSVDGDTVLVQPGTYVENINFDGKNITVASLFLTNQDTTYISQTIINGSQPSNPDSASVVTFCSGEDSTAVLIGFTITGGSGTLVWMNWLGGGIFCYHTDPSLENVTIRGNTSFNGGGIYCYASSPSLDNVTISGNSTVGSFGGGIYCDWSSLSLKNVTISGNSTPGNGGGIYCGYQSDLSLVNVTISGNTSFNGGGIYCWNSSLSLKNVTISGNSTVGVFGGGILCCDSSLSLKNVTISGNSAVYYGGGIYCIDNSNTLLINSILWNDTPQEVYFHQDGGPNSITISYSDIQGGEAGIVTNNNGTVNWLEGNIDEDPLFVGTGEHPYDLTINSPCIDAGIPDTTGLNLPPWDIIGNLRIWDGDGDGTAIIDMGVYEYGAPPYVDIDDNVIVQTHEVFLHQNYPNPFNPSTTINYSLKENSKILLKIYNIKGQLVKTLVNDIKPAGEHSAIWDGRDYNQQPVGSGIYFYKLKTKEDSQIRKMILLR